MLQENLSVAPMMEITDAHFRCLLRGVSRKTVLYTEMIVDDIIHHGSNNLDFFMGRHIEEHPSVIQLGGYDPERLASAAAICEQFGGQFGEININCGCPSQRVSQRCFGAKLMLEPDLVREIVNTMTRRVQVPITVKCRIGVDNKDSYDELKHFIAEAHSGGANKFIIHARKCLLKGLTTKQNRDIPPLKYEVVHRLVKDFPDLKFVLNGGILTLPEGLQHIDRRRGFDYDYAAHCREGPEDSEDQLPPAHGVMIGRAVYNNPLLLASADSSYFDCPDVGLSRRQLLERYIKYCEWCQSPEGPKKKLTQSSMQTVTTATLIKPVHNVMNSLQHCSMYKMLLNDLYVERVKAGQSNPSCREVIEGAMDCISEEDLDRPLGNPTAFEDRRRPLSANPYAVPWLPRDTGPPAVAVSEASSDSAVAVSEASSDSAVAVSEASSGSEASACASLESVCATSASDEIPLQDSSAENEKEPKLLETVFEPGSIVDALASRLSETM